MAHGYGYMMVIWWFYMMILYNGYMMVIYLFNECFMYIIYIYVNIHNICNIYVNIYIYIYIIMYTYKDSRSPHSRTTAWG